MRRRSVELEQGRVGRVGEGILEVGRGLVIRVVGREVGRVEGWPDEAEVADTEDRVALF